ncbi:MAG: hypothetical protein IJO91_08415 [Oscillospiraceae bacterium]|nr:hypothetical protein [Oscillospiraceae bacterium]
MGFGYCMRCPQCEKAIDLHFGTGTLYPHTYTETLKKACTGKLGETYKQFFKQHPHPDGAISIDHIVLVCKKCGNIDNRPSHSIFIKLSNRPNRQKRQSLYSLLSGEPDPEYISHKELTEDYKLYSTFPHKCSKCSADMSTISTEDFLNADFTQPCHLLKCPDCKIELEYKEFINWD